MWLDKCVRILTSGPFILVFENTEHTMKIDSLKLLLLVIATSLVTIALHPYIAPPPVAAQSVEGRVFIEPGVYMLRAPDGSQQVLGKVVVDLRSGNIWGFPTFSQNPYPVSASTRMPPPTSHPFLLGKFALADMDR